MDGDATRGKFGVQVAARFLARAHDHVVDLEHTRCLFFTDGDVQPRVVDALVRDAADHLDAARLERRAMHPTGRLAEPGADARRLALQEEHLPRRIETLRTRKPAA
jgi:hypothetical protein